MLEINGFGTPKLRNRKTQSKKDLNMYNRISTIWGIKTVSYLCC